MIRERSIPRPDWQTKVERLGLSFHTDGGVPYWFEDVCYSFTESEIDVLEDATNTLHDLCLQAAERLIIGGDLDRLSIPRDYWPWIADSWRRGDPSLYGRFDLAYDGVGPPKMLEYNADTPTVLLEAAVIQWHWLQDLKPSSDQFNSIHERLIDAWKSLKLRMKPDERVHFTGILDEAEDQITIDYMRDVCQQSGIETVPLDIAQVGWNGHEFTDLDANTIRVLFKLYPWEWLLQEEFAKHLLKSQALFIEPPWKMVLSTKAILPILWEMFPDHPNLLAASFERSNVTGCCVEKPIHGREGEGIRLLLENDLGGERGGRIWQAYHPLPVFDEQYAVIGSWVIGGEAAGIGIRESTGPITGNDCRFVPHHFGARKSVGTSIAPQQEGAPKNEDRRKVGFPRNADVIATRVLFTVISLIFVGQMVVEHSLTGRIGSFDPDALIMMGGLNRDLVLQHWQIYRMISAVFLHANFIHLVCNGIVLLFAGRNLEYIVGRWWLLSVYVTGGMAGSVMSMIFNPSNVVSVGASGAIMGLLSTLFVLTFQEIRGTKRLERQLFLLRLLIPAMLPAAGAHVDVAAHVGGVLGGVIMGLILTWQWKIYEAESAQ